MLVVVAVLAARASLAAEAPIVAAARQQDTARVRTLIAARADVNATQADGATALHWAVHWSDLELVDLLLRAGARASVANELEVTPLAMACDAGQSAIVSRLIDAGAAVNERPARRPPPLHLCVRRGAVEAVTRLLAAGANVDAPEPLRGQTALMWAAANGHPGLVRLLLDAGADPRARSRATRLMINRADPNDIYTAVIGEVSLGRSTAFLFAVSRGDLASARLLADAGSPIDDVTADATSALVIAVHSGHRDVAEWLIGKGANVNASGAGYTALHAAVLRGDGDSAARLLARGANVNARIAHGTQTVRAGRGYVLPENLTGATPFLLAAKFLENDILRRLAASGADPRVALADGTTALMLAAGVLSQGPLFDRRGRITVLRQEDEAAARAAVETILSGGADPNAVNAQGDTALHGAAIRGYPSVVTRLLSAGARRDAANAKGQKAFDLADGRVKDLLLP